MLVRGICSNLVLLALQIKLHFKMYNFIMGLKLAILALGSVSYGIPVTVRH